MDWLQRRDRFGCNLDCESFKETWTRSFSDWFRNRLSKLLFFHEILIENFLRIFPIEKIFTRICRNSLCKVFSQWRLQRIQVGISKKIESFDLKISAGMTKVLLSISYCISWLLRNVIKIESMNGNWEFSTHRKRQMDFYFFKNGVQFAML